MKVFISYSSHDDAAVRSLAEDLAAAHQQVWLDQELGGGDAWWAEILAQIRGCTVFVFALSDHSLRSKPCRSELDYAEALGLPILPVQIAQVSTYRTDPIFAKQLVDYRDSTRASGIALVSALHERRLGRAELPDPLPEPPPIPYEYLLKLGAAIRGRAELSPAVQAAAAFELREALNSEDDATVCEDIRELLRTLLARKEVTYAIGREITAILGDSAEPVPDDQATGPTAPGAVGSVRQQATGSDVAAQVVEPSPPRRDVRVEDIAYLRDPAGRSYPLQAGTTRIGRLSDNDIVLDDPDVSRHHANIVKTGADYVINDLRSANGVHVQHEKIRSTATLSDGDDIRICDHEFTFSAEA